MRKIVIECGKRMLDSVLTGVSCKRHGNTAQSIGKCHTITSFHIATILYGTDEIFSAIRDCSQTVHITHLVMLVGDITLNRVEHSIKALICGELRWNRFHQFCINDSNYRMSTSKSHFLLSFGIARHTPWINLATGTCCRRNSYNWKRFLCQFLSPANIIPDRTTVGSYSSDSF